MIDRKLLKASGFRKVLGESSWKGETWYHDDAEFFVFFDKEDAAPNCVYSTDSVAKLIQEIIRTMESDCNDRIAEIEAGEDW